VKKMLRHLALYLTVASFPLLTGCTTLVVGSVAMASGYYVYSRGTYVAILDASLFDADRALRSVGKRAQFTQLNRKCDGYGCTYLYQDVNGLKVRFRLQGISPDTTKLHIRVGKLGSKDSSQDLLKAIDEELQLGRQ